MMHRKCTILLVLTLAGIVHAEPLTLPLDRRPAWLERDGIVMAGSWEPLLFRVRRDGSEGYTPTPQQRADYEREHSPEMIARLKELGVNFVMMHCYKGGGLEAERESMADAVRFARLCRDAGMRVGVYTYSGAFIWELFFKEMPEAKDWVVLDASHKPVTYGRAGYRYYWNRNHPDAQTFYRKVIDFAVNDIKVDLVHFDNYVIGPGAEAPSAGRFRRHLRDNFTAAQLARMGVGDIEKVQPPLAGTDNEVLRRVWQDFCCRSLAESYHDMGRYARTLRADVLVECNPGGVHGRTSPPVDHDRLLTGGEAFWDEGVRCGYEGDRLHSHVRTYKVARRMDNIAFAYTITPLEMAESMAFNRDCLGCVCWFEYGRLVARPGFEEPVSPDLMPFIRFYRDRRDLLKDTTVVADVAVLRSFPSQVFADGGQSELTYRIEEELIRNRVPFQIIYDSHLNELGRYRVLVLAGCVAMSDRQIEEVQAYVRGGGRLCIVGPVATHDEWMLPREQPGLSDLAEPQAVRVEAGGDAVLAIRNACGEALSFSVDGAEGLCAEFMQQANRRLVHLVNYRPERPVEGIAVKVRLPAGKTARGVALADPTRPEDLKIDYRQEGGTVAFTVPRVEVYAIAIVSWE